MNKHDCVQREDIASLRTSVDRLNKEMFNGDGGIIKTIPVLTSEVERLVQSVDSLRTVISGFQKFQSETIGSRLTIKNAAPWIAILLTGIGLWFAINRQIINTSQAAAEAQDKITRQLWWKQDRILDSTTRGIPGRAGVTLDTTKFFIDIE